MSRLKSRLVGGVSWLAGARATGQIVTWTITIVVVRLLSPQDYGLMGMAYLFTGFLILFNEIGLGAAIVQKSDLSREHISDLTWIIFAFNVVLLLFVLLFAPAVARYFNEPALAAILRTLGAGFIVNGIGVASGYRLQRDMEFGKKARAELAGAVTGSVTTLALAATAFGVWSLVFGYLAQQLITNALYCVHAPPGIHWAFSARRARQFVNFGFQVTLARICWYVASNSDFLIVGRVLGSLQLGYYSLAFQLSSLPIERLMTVVSQVALPSFSSVQNDVARLRSHYLRLVGICAFVTFPMFIGLFLVAERAVGILLTSTWLPIVVPLKLLSIVACFRSIETMNAPLVLARGRTEILLWNSVLQALVLPVSFYVGAQYGLEGVAIAWLVTRPILFTVVTARSVRVIEISFGSYLRVLTHPVVGSLVMAAVVMLVETTLLAAVAPGVAFGVMCGVGCLTYVAYGVLFNSRAIAELLDIVTRRRPGRWGLAAVSGGKDPLLGTHSENESRLARAAQ